MSKLKFKYHPLIEGLKINEDGTEIYFEGEQLPIKMYKTGTTKAIKPHVYINHKLTRVIKLVCEAWIGSRPTIEHAARKKDENAGNHYTNLYWGKKGMTISSAANNIQNQKWIRQKTKLTQKEYKEIFTLWNEGVKISELSEKYQVSEVHISRIIKKNETSV